MYRKDGPLGNFQYHQTSFLLESHCHPVILPGLMIYMTFQGCFAFNSPTEVILTVKKNSKCLLPLCIIILCLFLIFIVSKLFVVYYVECLSILVTVFIFDVKIVIYANHINKII